MLKKLSEEDYKRLEELMELKLKLEAKLNEITKEIRSIVYKIES